MDLIQTLYINTNKDPFYDTFGWAAPEYHLIAWALSSMQLHKLYGKVTLFANSQAARFLIDKLQLPFTHVNIALDELTLINPYLWALPKIYTYSLQEKPFLHIDGDVFLFEQLNPMLLERELIAQNVEVATDNYYTLTQKELMRRFTFLPSCVKTDFESGIPIQACNAVEMPRSVFAFHYIFQRAEMVGFGGRRRVHLARRRHKQHITQAV